MSERPELSRRRWVQGAAAATGAGALSALSPSAPAAEEKKVHLPQAAPEAIGIDSKRLERAYALLTEWTSGPKAPMPGAAILVGRNGKTLEPRYFGRQGPEPDAEPLRRDALFYMASVTKPVIYMAGLMLMERGLLNLSDRVSRYLPEYTGPNKDDCQVLHLYTHTCGLPDELPHNAELRRSHATRQKLIEESIKAEAAFPPGTKYSYSSSGTLALAEIVQRLSGKTISEFLKREIIDPLGLKSTGLGSQGFARERLVRTVTPEYQQPDFSWNSPYWQELGSPAGGLFSTPEDYAVICGLMLGGGQVNGVRLLSKATVRQATTNRLHDMPNMPEAIQRTQPWGLGWRLNHLGMSDSWGDLLSRRVFGHTGSVGNVVWMDPETQGFCLILSNYLRSRAPWRLVHLSNIVASALV